MISLKSIFIDSRRNEFRNLMRYSLPLSFSIIVLAIFNQVDVLSLAYFYDSKDIGYYSVGMTLALLIGIIPGTLTHMFFPKVTKLYQNNDRSDSKRVLSTLTKYSVFSSIILLFMILTNGKFLLQTIFGSEFLGAFNSLVILSFGVFATYSTGPTGTILNAADKTSLTMKSNITGGLAKLILTVPFLFLFGPLGVALSTTASMALRNILTLFYVKKYLKIYVFDASYLILFFKFFIVSVLFLFINHFFELSTLVILFLTSILSIFLIFSSWMSDFFTDLEKTLIVNALISIRSKIW